MWETEQNATFHIWLGGFGTWVLLAAKRGPVEVASITMPLLRAIDKAVILNGPGGARQGGARGAESSGVGRRRQGRGAVAGVRSRVCESAKRVGRQKDRHGGLGRALH